MLVTDWSHPFFFASRYSMLVTDWIHPFFCKSVFDVGNRMGSSSTNAVPFGNFSFISRIFWVPWLVGMHTAHRCDENILRPFFRYSATKFRRRNIQVVKLDSTKIS